MEWLNTCTCLFLLSTADAARILAIGSLPSYSHQSVFKPIWRELSLRGHQVVLLTTNPLKDASLTNLTEIDLSFSYEIKKQHKNSDLISGKKSVLHIFSKYIKYGVELSVKQLEHPDVQKLIHDESHHFDLVMFEFMSLAFGAFAHKFQCPLIALQSYEINPPVFGILGCRQHPSIYPASLMFPFYKNLTFFERLKSSIFQVVFETFFVPKLMAANTALVRKYFGEDYPEMYEIIRNFDMVFHNSNPAFKTIKPSIPSLVEFGGGIHIQPLKPLPEDIKSYMDGAENGVIYFSFGSNIQSSYVTDDLKRVIINTLVELPYRVLWKFEENSFTVPVNVKIMPWFPQQDILRHANVKAFITQCGLQSLEEALYSHVPVICIPFFFDQPKNAMMVEDLGIGIRVNKDTVSKDILKSSIFEVINNPKYKQKMVELDNLSKDQPMTGLEKVIWWTEYVIRNKGARHLRSALIDFPTYQYYMLDVIGFVAATIFLVMYIVYRLLISVCCYRCKKSQKVKTQ